MDFNNLKSTVKNVSIDMNMSMNESRRSKRTADLMNSSGLGISIQAYLKSGSFNLKTGNNSQYLGAIIKEAFEDDMTEHLGGYERYSENKLSKFLDQLLVFDDLWI